jgi:hypothetical protein
MTTTLAEPEWDQSTRDAALALDLYESSLCPLHGGPRHECMNGQEYVAGEPYRCAVTTARSVARDGTDYPHPEALLWVDVTLRPEIEVEEQIT